LLLCFIGNKRADVPGSLLDNSPPLELLQRALKLNKIQKIETEAFSMHCVLQHQPTAQESQFRFTKGRTHCLFYFPL